jgi:hypothetical protein
MFKAYDRDLRAAGELGRLKAAVAGDDLFLLIDQNGRIESERFDASGDGSNLSPIMFTRIARVGVQIGGREKRELTLRGWRFAAMSPLLLEPIFRLEMRIA